MKNIKYYTIYNLEFMGDILELHYITEFTDIKEVYNWIDTQNFTVNYELESEVRQEFLMIELKNGERVNNKKYTIEHLNYKFLVISEYDKPYN